MKKLILLSIFIFIGGMVVNGQELKNSNKELKFKVEAGYAFFFNGNNKDEYLLNSFYQGRIYGALSGAHIKFTLPTKYEFIDFVFGAMIIKNTPQSHRKHNWVIPYKSSSSYIINGGGVYAGISPKWKGKYFGLTSDFGVGIFPFKEYAHSYWLQEEYPTGIDIHISRGSTFGAMASVGFYVNFSKRIGINPTYNMLVAGGSNGSFLFTGFIIPLTVKF